MASPVELQQQIAELKFRLLKLERRVDSDTNTRSANTPRSSSVIDDHDPNDNNESSQAVAPVPASMAEPLNIPIAATRVVMHQIVRPAETDALGICFGGQVSCLTSKLPTCMLQASTAGCRSCARLVLNTRKRPMSAPYL